MKSEKIKNYAYYEKLGFGNYKSWSKEDFSQFLLFDYFNGIKNDGGSGIKEAFLKDQQFLIRKYSKHRLIIKLLDKIFLKLYLRNKNKNKNKKTILFRTSQYASIILEAKKYYNIGLTACGKKDRLFAFLNFIGYVSINDLTQYILCYLNDKKIEYLYQLVEETEKKLKIVKPDYIVLRSDGPPLERAIVLASKKLGITTLATQHGVENSSGLFDNEVSDYILVWGKYFKDLFLSDNKRKSEDIYILGLPYLINKTKSIGVTNSRKVCYLGQDYERYDESLLQIKVETIKNLDEICKKLGLDFVYRPHPGDDRDLLKEKLSGISFTDKNEKIEETFKKADIFISFFSTALVEATMRQKITLQLMNFPIRLDNLEKLGVCNKSFKNIEELENYLAKIIKASDLKEFEILFNNDYMETRSNPGKRFLEIIEEIEKNKKS